MADFALPPSQFSVFIELKSYGAWFFVMYQLWQDLLMYKLLFYEANFGNKTILLNYNFLLHASPYMHKISEHMYINPCIHLELRHIHKPDSGGLDNMPNWFI